MNLSPVTDNQCVIKAHRSELKRRSFVFANSLQSKFKTYERKNSILQTSLVETI